MDKPENVIKTPNQVAPPEKPEAPHLTEKDLETIRFMQASRNKANAHFEWCMFRRMADKPQATNKPKTFNEEGKVVVCEGREAPIAKGNLRRGTLRNKKCSCGSGKKFKRCCLLKQNS